MLMVDSRVVAIAPPVVAAQAGPLTQQAALSRCASPRNASPRVVALTLQAEAPRSVSLKPQPAALATRVGAAEAQGVELGMRAAEMQVAAPASPRAVVQKAPDAESSTQVAETPVAEPGVRVSGTRAAKIEGPVTERAAELEGQVTQTRTAELEGPGAELEGPAAELEGQPAKRGGWAVERDGRAVELEGPAAEPAPLGGLLWVTMARVALSGVESVSLKRRAALCEVWGGMLRAVSHWGCALGRWAASRRVAESGCASLYDASGEVASPEVLVTGPRLVLPGLVCASLWAALVLPESPRLLSVTPQLVLTGVPGVLPGVAALALLSGASTELPRLRFRRLLYGWRRLGHGIHFREVLCRGPPRPSLSVASCGLSGTRCMLPLGTSPYWWRIVLNGFLGCIELGVRWYRALKL